MADISDLEQRLTHALARMRAAHLSTRQALQVAQSRIAALESAPPVAATTVPADPAELAQAKADVARLTAALDAEREQGAATARAAEADRAALLEARDEITALRASDRLEGLQSGAVSEVTQARVSALETALDQLRQVSAQLRQNNAALRKAAEAGVTDPELVNSALQSEIDALSAARAADRAEIDSILAALKPIVEETENA